MRRSILTRGGGKKRAGMRATRGPETCLVCLLHCAGNKYISQTFSYLDLPFLHSSLTWNS